MNSELYIPSFVNSVDCRFYGKELSNNQHLGGYHFSHTEGRPFSDQRNPLTNNTQLYMSSVVNLSTCDVSGMNFTQQENNPVHDDVLPFGPANSDSKIAGEKKQAREKTFVCEVCGRGFSQRSSLTVHSRIHSGERPFPCEVCEKKFVSKEGLRSHQLVHTQERRFECDLCGKKFVRKQDMQHHRLTHTGERPHQCEVCQKTFSVKKRLKVHMLTHTEERPYACDQCDWKFKSRMDLKAHIRLHGGVKPYKCEQCPMRFFTKFHLRLHHQRIHSDVTPFSCHVCQKQYKTPESFHKHVRNHVEQNNPQTVELSRDDTTPAEVNLPNLQHRSQKKCEQFICDICREEFTDQCELEKHHLYHKREKPFACFICGLRFFRSPNLKAHLRIIHSESELFICETCDKCFHSKKLLQNHIVCHSRQWACDLCGKAFQSEPKLLLHSRVHNRISHHPPRSLKYACNFCERKFWSKQKFLSHSKSHNKTNRQDKGEFPCDHCGKRFTRQRYRLRHILYHTRRRLPHQCTVCSKRFNDRYHLRRHARVHTGEKPYSCPVCQIQYSNRDSFLRHLRTHSGEENDLQMIEGSVEQYKLTEGNNISFDVEEKEFTQNQRMEKQIVSKSAVKAFNEQTHLKSLILSTQQSTSGEANPSECVEVDAASRSLSALAELANRFINDAERKEIPRNPSFIDSEVMAVVSQLVTTVEKSPLAEESPIACGDIQRRKFPQSRYLQKHGRIDSRAKSFGCEVCGMSFLKEEELNLHHCVQGPFVCGICEEEFVAQCELEKHRLENKCANPFACDICGRSFVQLQDLTIHLRVHCKKSFPCYKCEEKFVSPEELRIHFVVHTETFSCETCSKTFARKERLAQHRLRHTGERPYACNRCDWKFKTRSELKSHARRHTGVKPHKCDECPMRFFTKAHLKLHQRIHSDVTPFSCHVCQKEYKTPQCFQKHVRSHSEQNNPQTVNLNLNDATPVDVGPLNLQHHSQKKGEQFICNVCREAFTEQCELEKHQLYHRREKPFACSICGLRFFRSSTLKAHFSNIHS